MIALYDQAQELRLEIRFCAMTRRERAETRTGLNRLLAEQAELDRAFDAQFAAHRKDRG